MKYAIAAAAAGALATVAMYNVQDSTTLFKVEPEVETEFQAWIASHGKHFGTTEEYNFRLAIFARKYELVLKHNSENADDHRLALNQFAVMSDHEYKKLLGFKSHKKSAKKCHKNKLGLIGGGDHDVVRKLENVTLPDSVDWRTSGAVTPVKNQE